MSQRTQFEPHNLDHLDVSAKCTNKYLTIDVQLEKLTSQMNFFLSAQFPAANEEFKCEVLDS
jgi:hypothetical protein